MINRSCSGVVGIQQLKAHRPSVNLICPLRGACTWGNDNAADRLLAVWIIYTDGDSHSGIATGPLFVSFGVGQMHLS